MKITHRIPVGFWTGGYPNDPTLPDPRTMVDEQWDSVERKTVIDYLKNNTVAASYRGMSNCRICGA